MPSGTRPAASALSLSPNSSNAAAPTGGPRRRAPSRDRGLGEPDRQAAATAQAGVVRRPIRDPMTLLRNMVTAVIEALERQRAILDGRGNRQPTSGRRRLAIHATKWRGDIERRLHELRRELQVVPMLQQQTLCLLYRQTHDHVLSTPILLNGLAPILRDMIPTPN